jgi:hypothetical protein
MGQAYVYPFLRAAQRRVADYTEHCLATYKEVEYYLDSLSIGIVSGSMDYKWDTRKIVRSTLLQEDFAAVVEFMIPRMILPSFFADLYSPR